MKWIGERISYIDDKELTTIVIYPEKTEWKNNLLKAWFSMWMLIGAIVIYQLFLEYTRDEKLMFTIFLSFWLYFSFKVGKSTFWQLKGKELIRINDQALILKKSIFSYGKAHTFFLENIRKIRVDELKESSIGVQFEKSFWVVGGERISFDYIGKNIRFGRKLNEQDTKLLFRLITNRIESRLKKKK
jgi:hypothetical protein